MAKDSKEKVTERKTNDWLGFAKYLVSALITTILWALIGSNFIFLQRQVVKGEKKISELFPYDSEKAPYWDSNDEKLKTRERLLELEQRRINDELRRAAQIGGNGNQQDIAALEARKNKILSKLGLKSYSFPYKGKSKPLGLKGDLYEWFSKSVEYSYTNGRKLLNDVLDTTSEFHPIFIILLCVPLLAFILFITPFYGLISTIIGTFNTPSRGSWTRYLVAFLFIFFFGMTVAGSVAAIQMLQVVGTFLILPLLMNWREVWSIITEHCAIFTAIFGLLVLAESFVYLKPEAVGAMGLTYAYLVWKSWKSSQTA